MTLPTRLDDRSAKPEGPGFSYHVIARAIGPWQSASPAMQSIARSLRERKENGLPRRFAPRNDSESKAVRNDDTLHWTPVHRRGQKAPYRYD